MEANAEKAVKLFSELMYNPGREEKKWKKIIKEKKLSNRFSDNSIQETGQALRAYMITGKRSSYLTDPTVKEMARLDLDTVLQSWRNIMQYRPEMYYVGRVGEQQAKSIMQPIPPKGAAKWKDSTYVLPVVVYKENTVLLMDVKDARQSQIYFYILGDTEQLATIPLINAFNSYFGEDMSSLVFQEIREFRSLAYTATATYRPHYNRIVPEQGRLGANISVARATKPWKQLK